MQKFEVLEGVALPLDRANVDTDAIIPQRWLVTVTRTGLGAGLFGAWRWDSRGHAIPDFVLNLPTYRHACIIVARDNYGCGSSREHAVWAHLDYGVRAVIAPSFGPIFQENCLNNGLLPVQLPASTVAAIMDQLHTCPGATCRVDLLRCEVTAPDGTRHRFNMDAGRRQALLEGWDAIDISVRQEPHIAEFQVHQNEQQPWLRS